MSRSGEGDLRFVIVTTNMGKAEEFQKIFERYGLKFRVEQLATIEIQSMDLREIAKHRVLHAYNVLREPVMVEDAGLFVEALGGFPGPFSSYVFRTIGIKGILKLMEGVRDRRAQFRSAIAFYSPLTEPVKIFTGEVSGWVAEEPRGTKGFGFDPIFIPAEGDGRTFGEMDVEEKNAFSHRARAAMRFAEWISKLRGVAPPYR
ncbi:MAG: XTP/dITP diphosphatase [Aigarchaeota archaeon]|nr:XTP/dITP diphosphatase [Aigarchaeota archaeon]MDW8021688.1 XTP/dITP diphosphatase [Nitrososphaerota archaeon]